MPYNTPCFEKISTPSLHLTHIGGYTAKILAAYTDKRVLSDFAKDVICKEAEDAFKNQIDDETPAGIWQGEFWGKLMLSATEVYKYTAKEHLRKFLRESALRVISYAREDGYIGSYKDSKNVFARQETPDGPCWCWNVWGRKYTLWGLIAVYEITGDKDILIAAERMATQLIDEFRECGIKITKTGTFCGMPSCSILKPMVLLYQHSGNKKYLDFCISDIADQWERQDGEAPNLIANSLSGKPVAEWYPNPDIWAKAYEMMSCFEGICELYRATGNEKYLESVKCFYDIINKYEKNALGSVAYNDMFANARYSQNTLSEPCDSIHYMRLSYELYMLSGDVKYMHDFEKCYFNAFMSGMFRNGEWSSRASRCSGRHMWTHQAKTQYQHCCLNNMGRGFIRYADIAVVKNGEYITVNQFEQFTAILKYDGGECRVEISDGYLSGKPITITARFSGEPQKLRVRIPEWSKANFGNATITDGYLEFAPDTSFFEIKLDFAATPVVCKFPYDPNDNVWNLNRFMSEYAKFCAVPEDIFVKDKRCTLTYGPLLLAKSKRFGNSEKDVFAEKVTENSVCTLNPIECDEAFALFEATFTNPDGSVYKTTVCDFASAANEILEDDRYHSIFF
ncbi:MAG: glycoside hydrolase family 127 protein [Clostridia bacterium]|nr:glycoside hydrolase family 127 protein [Clostridia bacterium]